MQELPKPNEHPKKNFDVNLQAPQGLLAIVPFLLWLFFAVNLCYLLLYFPKIPSIHWGDWLRINGFTLLIWTTVSFFSAVVSTFSRKYLIGFRHRNQFGYLSLGFFISVVLLVMANHVLLFVLSWFLMGIFMSQLIGVNRSWAEARQAAVYTQKFFTAGTIFLGLGLFLLAFSTQQFSIDGIISHLGLVSLHIKISAACCIILAAIIQSAMYPFQRWLLSAMTSPTPASALMHAGFVNGAGILLAFFASLLFQSHTLTVLFAIGGITAVTAQFTKLLQVNVKQKLACSTIAQMGFMIMQCGLGFFNAAVAHLILHGFYKAYLFLSAGEEVRNSTPNAPYKLRITPLQALVVLIFGGLGALLFAFLTGKGTTVDSGIILTLIVAITVGQITYNIVKQKIFNPVQKMVYPILLFSAGIVLYSLFYNGVTVLMASMPMTDVPVAISYVHIVFGIIFLIGFFTMKLGIYTKVPWLYVKLLNDSQPQKNTIITSTKKLL